MGMCKMNKENIENSINEEIITNDIIVRYENIYRTTQEDICHSIAIHKSLMAAGCGNLIKIYNFNQGYFQLIQILKQHTDMITVLTFMNSHLISGDFDGKIKYWSCEGDCKYLYDFVPPYKRQITNIVVNRYENLLITADQTQEIKIWKPNIVWKCCQIITFSSDFVAYQININPASNQFVACGSKTQFLVFYWDKKWKKLQRIQGCGKVFFRACFITDTLIANQPYLLNMLELFKFSEQLKLFQKLMNVQVDSGSECWIYFPMQFIKKKKILVDKNGQSINIIKKKCNNQFELQQVIPLQSSGGFGTMTNDGDYLVFWDFGVKEIQVWKCVQQ